MYTGKANGHYMLIVLKFSSGINTGNLLYGRKSQVGGQRFGPKGQERVWGFGCNLRPQKSLQQCLIMWKPYRGPSEGWVLGEGGSEPPLHQLACLGSTVSSPLGSARKLECNLRPQKHYRNALKCESHTRD